MKNQPSEPAAAPEADDSHGDEPQPFWVKLIEPFRSEAAAFRMLLTVAAACGVVAIVVLIARALF